MSSKRSRQGSEARIPAEAMGRRDLLRIGLATALGSTLPGCQRQPGGQSDASVLHDAAPPLDRSQPAEGARDVPGDGEHPLVFQGYRGLADLPYFELDAKGELRCTVTDLPPAVDFHVHLGFAFALSPAIDLLRAAAQTAYYIDCDGAAPACTLNLDAYLNTIATADMLGRMDAEIASCALPGGSDVARTHTIPNLLAEMDAMGVRRAVVLPIALGLPFGDKATDLWLAAIKDAGAGNRLIPFGSVHPGDGKAVEKLRAYHDQGIRGVKLHPPMQRFYPDDDGAMAIYAECAKLDLPVLFHAGRAGIEPAITRQYAEMKHYLKAVSSFPQVRFVFGHAGCREDFPEALALAKAHQNIWMEFSGQGVSNLRTLVTELGPERLFFGTDWPFYPEAPTLAKVLIVAKGDRTLRDLLLGGSADAFLAAG